MEIFPESPGSMGLGCTNSSSWGGHNDQERLNMADANVKKWSKAYVMNYKDMAKKKGLTY